MRAAFSVFQPKHSETEIGLAKTISASWRAFATSANTSTTLPWPPFFNGTREFTAMLSPTPKIAVDLFKLRCDLFDSLPYALPN